MRHKDAPVKSQKFQKNQINNNHLERSNLEELNVGMQGDDSIPTEPNLVTESELAPGRV